MNREQADLQGEQVTTEGTDEELGGPAAANSTSSHKRGSYQKEI